MNLNNRFMSAVFLRLLAVACSLGTTIILSRTLDTSSFGSYVFAITVLTMVAIPLDAGLPQLVTREVSSYHQSGEYGLVKGVILYALAVVAVASVVVLVAWICFSLLIGSRLTNFADANFVGLALVSLPLIALGSTLGAVLLALERYFVGQFFGILMNRMLMLLLLFSLWLVLGRDGLTTKIALYAYLIAAALALAMIGTMLWRNNSHMWRGRKPQFKTRYWISTLIPFSLIAGLQVLVSKTDVLMLRAIQGTSEVAIYHVASQLGNLVFISKVGVMMVMGTRISRLYQSGDKSAMQRELSGAARFMLMTSLPIAIALLFIGPYILPLLFGAKFSEAYTAMAILAVGYVGLALFGSVDTLLRMTGNERAVLTTVVAAMILNAILNALLIGRFGAAGAAAATAISMIAWRVTNFWQAKRRLGLTSFIVSLGSVKDT